MTAGTGVPTTPGAILTAADLAILDEVERTIAEGIALKRWWERTDATGSYADRFRVLRSFNPSDSSFGFYDVATLPDRTIPVNGIVDEMLYDVPKGAAPTAWRDEFREFVLHYFLRVSAFRLPTAHTERRRYAQPGYLETFSWCAPEESDLGGFGYAQLYYKRRDTGEIGKFPLTARNRIEDLRDLGRVYEWIVLNVEVHDFNLAFNLPRSTRTKLEVTLDESALLVITPDFVVNADNPDGGAGAYGFGYAFLHNPEPSPFGYGPGEFDVAFQTITFQVGEDGRIRVRTVFVENRPTRILNLSLNPAEVAFRVADVFSFGLASAFFPGLRTYARSAPDIISGFDPVTSYISLAGALTNGEAAEDLCISMENLERLFLLQHYLQHYEMLTGSLMTWRHVRNWLDRSQVPEWAILGRMRQ